MDTFRAQILWQGTPEATKANFSRDHRVIVPGKLEASASSAPSFKGNKDLVNPEELLVSALASCQMLTYVYLCFQNNLPIRSYRDEVEGQLGKDANGRTFVAKIKLLPQVVFGSAESQTMRATAIRLIREAHDQCFVANTLKTDVEIEPRFFFE